MCVLGLASCVCLPDNYAPPCVLLCLFLLQVVCPYRLIPLCLCWALPHVRICLTLMPLCVCCCALPAAGGVPLPLHRGAGHATQADG
jgi:hypothetical protein